MPADSHCVPSGDCGGAVLKRAPTLVSSDVIVGVARTAMEGASGQPDTGREFVQFLDAIRHEVEPRITVLRDLGVVDVYHLLFSLPGGNLAFGDMFVGVNFPGEAMAEAVATDFEIESVKLVHQYALQTAVKKATRGTPPQ